MLYIQLTLALLCAVVTHIILGWYTSWIFIPVFFGMLVAWFLVWHLVWWIIIIILTLLVDKKKEVTHISPFYRWAFVQSMQIALLYTNVKVHIEGKEKIPKDQRFLVVANHLSNYDPISILYALRKHTIVFISKPENFNIPFAGPIMHKAGFMPIDRDHVKNAIVTINKAADYIKRGETSVFIFPEGTRNRTEKPLLEFKNGAFKIATKAGCPLVIIAISGTEKVKKRIPLRSHVYLKVVDVIPAEKVKEMRTGDLSDYAYEQILNNITHGKEK